MKEESEEIPLKTILQNFLNHVENLEVAREESLSGEGEDQYEKEFQALKAFSEDLKNKDDFSCSEGDSEANRKKNRYKDILPFNYSRVELSEYPGIPGSDYINANYIKGASGSNAYIASQGPLPNTVNDWWRLVVEKEVQVIVMACNEQEGGKHKCEGYWSDEETPSRQFGKYSVNLLKSREICPDFLVRTMRLSWAGEEGGEEESRTVCQFHYSAWPDHGIPTQVKPLLEMVRLVRDCQASETLPVLVHCSAGCGRTGSICVIDYVWGLLKTGKLSADFSVYSLVQDMRRQRIAMVQTVDQYMLCHRAVRELFLEQLRVIDSHPYENVGRDGRPLVDKDGAANTPEYETIDYSAKPEAGDTERLGPKPRMGVGMLSREKSPSMILTNGEHSENSSDNSLPATLDEFRSAKSTPSGTPKIHEPPNPPQNLKEPAAQRFKKGNLRLLKADDGGWKLEEMEQERRRSMEAGASKHDLSGDNNNQIKQEPHEAAKPPQGDVGSRKERRKKSSREEKSESSLLRRPSMKKIKAYFDKDKNKENKDDRRETDTDREDSLAGSVAHKLAFSNEYASAVAKIPSLETSGGFFHDSLNIPELGGQSKSVPSSLDRKQRYRDQDVSQIRGVEKTSNNNLGKLWPLKKENKQSMNAKSVSSERLQVGDKPALPVKRSKSMKSNSKPVSVIPVLPGGGEPSFIVDHVRSEQDASYDTYPKSKQKSDEIIDLTKKSPDHQMPHSLHNVGSRENLRSAVSLGQPPPKPKRDWSSLNHDYANVKVTPMTPGPEKASFDFPDPGGHSRQGSREETNKSSQFLDQQMAKLMARKTSGQDEVDGAIKRSKSGDNLSRRNSEILDDDTRRILRDCQEYLLGASFEAREDGGLRPDAESARGRSAHSSPAGSYNKYHQPGAGVMRSSSGNLSLSPSVASSARSSSLRSPDKSFQSPGRNTEQPPDNEYSSLQSDLSEASPQSEAGHSSLETSEARIHEYENVPNVTNNYIDGARGKVSAATNVRTRERRNSFRQAVDKVDGNGRPYEQIWFRGEEGEQREQASPREMEPGPMYANTGAGGSNTSLKVEPVNKSQLRKSDSGSLRSQSGSNIRSGSYDNIPPGPGLNTTQAIFTLEPNPTAYEIINFQQPGPVRGGDTRKMSPGVQPGPGHALQSVGLVAEACRDHEQQQRAASQPKRPVLTKQNSGGNIRAPPPPYQAPPGPPGPPYQSPPVPPPYKHGGHYVAPPKHISPTYSATRYQEPGPQVETSTPKRPVSSKMGPPPPYGANITEGVRKMDINSSNSRPNSTRPVPSLQSTGPEAVTLRTGRGRLSSRDDSELSRRQKSMKRNSSLVATARLSMGDFILSSTGLGLKPDKSIKTVVGGGAPGSVVQGARTAVMVGGGAAPDFVPGVDLDRVAASMSQTSDSVSLAGSSSGPGSGARQLRSLAGAITGAAANFKSKLASAVTGAGAARSSPSPPDPARTKGREVREVPIRLEGGDQGAPPAFNGEKSPHVIPLTVPGAEYGYPHRIEKRPLGPRETPNFQKKQEYL